MRFTILKFPDFPGNISKKEKQGQHPDPSSTKELLRYRRTSSFDQLSLTKTISRQLTPAVGTYLPKSALH